jgi:hypothetical protein
MISDEQVARIRHLFHAEHWKIGTIAAELHLHPDTVRTALDTDRFRNQAKDLSSFAMPCGPPYSRSIPPLPPFCYDPGILVTLAYLAVILATPQGAFAWGRAGREIIVIVAEHYMRPETTARMRELLALFRAVAEPDRRLLLFTAEKMISGKGGSGSRTT